MTDNQEAQGNEINVFIAEADGEEGDGGRLQVLHQDREQERRPLDGVCLRLPLAEEDLRMAFLLCCFLSWFQQHLMKFTPLLLPILGFLALLKDEETYNYSSKNCKMRTMEVKNEFTSGAQDIIIQNEKPTEDEFTSHAQELVVEGADLSGNAVIELVSRTQKLDAKGGVMPDYGFVSSVQKVHEEDACVRENVQYLIISIKARDTSGSVSNI